MSAKHFLLFCLVPLMLMGCDDDEESQNLPPVTVSTPVRQSLTEWDEYTGRFQAVERVELRARVSGYLEDIRFTDGQKVKKGDILFVIDQRPFRIDLERARAAHDLAKKEYGRYQKLAKTSASSVQALDERQQQLREAKANLESAELNLEFTEIKSPIDGRVSRHLVDEGNLISGGDLAATLLTTVIADDPIHFYFDASEQDMLKYIRLDQEGKRTSSREEHRPVFVKLQDELEFAHEGKMDFVDNELDDSSGSLQGRAILANPDGMLLPGLFGRMRLAGSGEYEAMLVPDEAIGSNQTQKIVYVLNKENVIEPHPVQLGPLHERKWRIIRDGLKWDDRIVWAGVARVRPGMKVDPKPRADEAAPQAPAEEAKPEAEAEEAE